LCLTAVKSARAGGRWMKVVEMKGVRGQGRRKSLPPSTLRA